MIFLPFIIVAGVMTGMVATATCSTHTIVQVNACRENGSHSCNVTFEDGRMDQVERPLVGQIKERCE